MRSHAIRILALVFALATVSFLLSPATFAQTVTNGSFASLFSLCSLFCTPSLCFQQLAASFAKTPGAGVTKGGTNLLIGFGFGRRDRRNVGFAHGVV